MFAKYLEVISRVLEIMNASIRLLCDKFEAQQRYTSRDTGVMIFEI